ncbi:MAG: beta-ketoacyl-ACP synthase II [Ardenticatenaceae bacterium]|nr:beta-ketoacyl-ACP synthase II [Ardenticatenaceae bacterium]
MARGRIRVVITGMGAITSLGLSAESMWQGVVNGRSGVTYQPTLFGQEYPIKLLATVQNFSPEAYMSHKEARRMALFSQFGVAASHQCLTDAGLLNGEGRLDEAIDPVRVGVIMGTCGAGLDEVRHETAALLAKNSTRTAANFIVKMLPNAPAANIAREFGLVGYNSTVSTACASGAQAIGEAAEVIRRGAADIMVAGGTEGPICDIGVAGFATMRAMTLSDDLQASRPFDLHRDGLVLGDGAACVTLERLEHALARHAPIYGELLGYGCASDAFHLAAPEPEGRGQVWAMRQAMDDAAVSPAEIDYISAHATSTPLGDAIETRSIKHVLGQHAYEVPISAAKSMLGHTVGTAGAIEAVISLLTIRDNMIHPTINYATPDPECDLNYVPNQAQAAPVDVVLSNSFGMGGQNVSLVIGRWR